MPGHIRGAGAEDTRPGRAAVHIPLTSPHPPQLYAIVGTHQSPRCMRQIPHPLCPVLSVPAGPGLSGPFSFCLKDTIYRLLRGGLVVTDVLRVYFSEHLY